VRRYLPDPVQRIRDRTIDPGKVFDLTLPLEEAAEGYRGHGRAPRHQGAAHPLSAEGEAGRRRACAVTRLHGPAVSCHLVFEPAWILSGSA
jgi:hypothetical protein